MQEEQVELLGPVQLKQAASQSIQLLFNLLAYCVELQEAAQVEVELWKKYP